MIFNFEIWSESSTFVSQTEKYESNIYVYLSGSARFFAHHGVDPQETIVGANFIIDLRLRTDFTHAAQTDELKGTVSYANIYAVVKKRWKLHPNF